MKKKHERYKLLRCIPVEEEESEAPKEEVPLGCHFSQSTIDCLIELGEALQKVHNRLISEGYSILDGRIDPPSSKTPHESNNTTIE